MPKPRAGVKSRGPSCEGAAGQGKIIKLNGIDEASLLGHSVPKSKFPSLNVWSDPPDDPSVAVFAVHIWRIRLTADPILVEHLQMVLSGDERARTERFHFPQDRAKFIIARAAVRKVLGIYLSLPAVRVRIEYAPGGKPFLRGHDGLHFNLSHSGSIALMAVSGHPVGVDVELVQPGFDFTDISNRYFLPAEIAGLNRTDAASRVQQFFSLWTRKEAVLKANGTGIAGLQAGVDDHGWKIADIHAAPGYAAAVAHHGTDLSYWQWQSNEVPLQRPSE